MRRWVAQGDLSAATLEQNETFVAEASGEPIAWAMLVPRESIGWLEDLWVEPRWIGHGIGRLLFERVARRAYELWPRDSSGRRSPTRSASTSGLAVGISATAG